MNRLAHVVLAFWILGVLNVQCVTNPKSGDIVCHLTTFSGKKVDCEEGGDIDEAIKSDIRPRTDVVCRTDVLKW